MSGPVDSDKLPSLAAAEYLRGKGIKAEPTTLKQWRWQRKGPVYYSEQGRIYYRPPDLDAFAAAVVRRIDPAASNRQRDRPRARDAWTENAVTSTSEETARRGPRGRPPAAAVGG